MSKFYRNCNGAGKHGVLILADRTFDFEYGQDSFYEAQKLLSETIGFVWHNKNGIWAESSDPSINIYVVGDTAEEAVKEFRAKLKEKEDYQNKFNNDLLFQLEQRLKSHDWTYMYSDDHRWWASGQANLDKINKLISILGVQGTVLWNKYCPADAA
mgnify:CR=1 FL=1